MLVHIGQADVGERIHNAWIRTLEDGVHTYDIFQEGLSKQKVGTKEFAQAVVSRLGQKPQTIKAVEYSTTPRPPVQMPAPKPAPKSELVGVDVYVDSLRASLRVWLPSSARRPATDSLSK